MNHLNLAHLIWEAHLQSGDGVIDATCGNGHDAAFLATLDPGQLICMDVQKEAIEATQSQAPRAQCILGCHHRLPECPNLKLIVYNLGYLPRGDKSITTQLETSRQSIRQALDMVLVGGMVSITFYPGHKEGLRELETLLPELMQLDSKSFSLSHHKWPTRHRSPELVIILKLR